MADIKPIETVYKGFKFRSRLEARWAVFFDSLGLKYEYEMEGYRLPSGAGYLPDFVLTNVPVIGACSADAPNNYAPTSLWPIFPVYVEIKPNLLIPYADLNKVVDFAWQGDNNVLLIIGTPMQEEMFLISRCTCEDLKWFEYRYEGTKPDEDKIVSDFLSDLRNFASVAFGAVPPSYMCWWLVYHSLPAHREAILKEAFLKAKQARFEFGESG